MNHITKSGIEETSTGWVAASCGCGQRLIAPDEETLIDMAMEHAYGAGRHDGQEDVAVRVRGHGS